MSFIATFRKADRDNPSLGIASMLSRAEGKLGPANRVRAFNIPLRESCHKAINGQDIASPACRAICYTHKLAEGRPTFWERAKKNFRIAQRDDFSDIAIGAILDSGVEAFKIHLAGDFFSREYLQAWSRIVRHCSFVRFWAYTRAWRVPDFVDSLTTLATHKNMRLVLSYDRDTGSPPVIPQTDRAWLATSDDEQPLSKSLITFRSSIERKFVPLTVMNSTPVCPHQNGKTNHTHCIDCNICLPTL